MLSKEVGSYPLDLLFAYVVFRRRGRRTQEARRPGERSRKKACSYPPDVPAA
jgi:hypothetical protein